MTPTEIEDWISFCEGQNELPPGHFSSIFRDLYLDDLTASEKAELRTIFGYVPNSSIAFEKMILLDETAPDKSEQEIAELVRADAREKSNLIGSKIRTKAIEFTQDEDEFDGVTSGDVNGQFNYLLISTINSHLSNCSRVVNELSEAFYGVANDVRLQLTLTANLLGITSLDNYFELYRIGADYALDDGRVLVINYRAVNGYEGEKVMAKPSRFEVKPRTRCVDQARRGNREAQARLSLMLFCADPMPLDIDEAYEWLEKAAKDEDTTKEVYKRGCEQGWAGAMYGMYLLSGMTSEEGNTGEWAHYLVGAAERGYVHSQCLLGMNHLYGSEGLEKDADKAEYWLLKAAQNGSTQAFPDLFHLYNEYQNPTDPKRAFQYILKASADGAPASLYYLAQVYEHGRGVRKDLVEAAMWYYLHAIQYPDLESEHLTRVSGLLSETELREAASKAEAWISTEAPKAKFFEVAHDTPLDWPPHR